MSYKALHGTGMGYLQDGFSPVVSSHVKSMEDDLDRDMQDIV